ncbi:MAG: acetylglutamate kinase [Chloroflexi bacterium]|nr:acetylglutamate kinase [Chloroflexota bacterium]
MVAQDKPIYVLKIGGRQLDEAPFLARLVDVVRDMHRQRALVLVHGGGQAIQLWQKRLGLTPAYVEGLRVTDEASLEVAEAVLSGLVNKYLVSLFINGGIRAAGISGVDDGLVRVTRMVHPQGDLGRVGEIHHVNPALIHTLLDAGVMPVVSPISLGRDGLTYNVNADHVARAVAAALRAARLYFISNVPGVLIAGQVVRAITAADAERWIEEGFIQGGMIPKVRSAIAAVQQGVGQAVITNLEGLMRDEGTAIVP